MREVRRFAVQDGKILHSFQICGHSIPEQPDAWWFSSTKSRIIADTQSALRHLRARGGLRKLFVNNQQIVSSILRGRGAPLGTCKR